jgi:hypothetical protein
MHYRVGSKPPCAGQLENNLFIMPFIYHAYSGHTESQNIDVTTFCMFYDQVNLKDVFLHLTWLKLNLKHWTV